MTKGALVIGGSVAGLQAALDLAESGIHVHLVDESPFLGSDGVAVVPQHLLNTRLLEVAKHPNVTVWTNTRVNRAEAVADQAGRFQVELRQHPRYVDLAKCTACGDCIQVCPVTVPGTDHKVIYRLEGAQPGCVAIDKLGKPPCSNTCPGGIHVQGYVALIAQGRFQEALDLIREAIPFPGICGRICTHPCEVNCRRAEVDSPVSIRALKRFVSDWELGHDRPRNAVGWDGVEVQGARGAEPQGTGDSQKVAVIGAGPAGMAVADRLARLGYQVTVFEKLPVIGGMMAVGIPEYRLPRDVIGREYRQIQDLGVEIRLNTTIGPGGDHTLDGLFATGYAAVCLAVGAHKSHDLRISGEALPGVTQGIELLKVISLSQQVGDPELQATLSRLLRKGPKTKAIVLGGGNTAMDVSRSLRRLGLKDVRIYYRRTRAEMPALPEEIEGAEQEGVAIEFLVAPVRLLGNATAGVTGLECVRMKLGEPDSSGRRRPVPIADSEFVVKVDLVALAIGQATQLDFLGEDHGIAITRDERINVDGTSFMTSRPGVFAAGDAVTADKMAVIEAIGMGKRAAAAIDAYLRGVPPHEVVVDAREVPIARRTMTEAEMVLKPRVPVPETPVAERVRGYAEVELGYTIEQAMKEAQRCLACGPCSECQACVHACKPGAVVHEQHEQFVDLEIGAVIYAGDPAHFDRLRLAESQGVYAVPPSNPLIGSAAAARAMFDLRGDVSRPAVTAMATGDGPARIGVFVCRCGSSIADAVDTEAVRDQAATWPDVVHTEVLPFSCSTEAAQAMVEAAEAHDLNRAVLAACSCCPIDQVCYSCTYQRVRCKDNLGVFHPSLNPDLPGLGGPGRSRAVWEFVNIREQCAWVHPDDRQAATAKATALVAAAVAKVRVAALKAVEERPVERSVLILGNGASARACQKALEAQSIVTHHVAEMPTEIRRIGGCYNVTRPVLGRAGTRSNSTWQATALVLAPHDAGEVDRLLAAFGEDGLRPRAHTAWGGLDTHRPGVWLCDPAQATAMSGAAAAARVAAWLGHLVTQPQAIAAVVDAARCRACNTCVEICEFGAPQLVGEEPQRSSWIDPAICTGCGTCAAHCPSGAITAGFYSDAQLTVMLEAALACASPRSSPPPF
jgi:NADPH-dependent glutamate synthase beta subunit-like oxidoreductase